MKATVAIWWRSITHTDLSQCSEDQPTDPWRTYTRQEPYVKAWDEVYTCTHIHDGFMYCFSSTSHFVLHRWLCCQRPLLELGKKKKCKLKWPNFSCLSVSVNKKSESDEEENFYSTLAWPSLLWQQTGLTFTIKQQCSSFYSGYHISRKQGLELSELQIPIHLIF